MKVKCDHRSKFSNLSNWKEEAWKKSGLHRDSNPWPPRYRCDALPTELWSHTMGVRSIYRVHIFPVQWSDVKNIWNNSYLYCSCRYMREKHGQNHIRTECAFCTKTFPDQNTIAATSRLNTTKPSRGRPIRAYVWPTKIFKRKDHLRKHLQNCPVLAKHTVEPVENKQSEPITSPSVFFLCLLMGREKTNHLKHSHTICVNSSKL